MVQVVTTNVGGKNFFVPSSIVVTAGSGRKLSIFNTTDAPHGFAIPSLGIELVLPPGVETPVDLPPLEAGHIYAINCHLHPPHRAGLARGAAGPVQRRAPSERYPSSASTSGGLPKTRPKG